MKKRLPNFLLSCLCQKKVRLSASFSDHRVHRRIVPCRLSDKPTLPGVYSPNLTSFKRIVAELVLSSWWCPPLRAMQSDQQDIVSQICPPAKVRGMKTLDRDIFSCSALIPALRVPTPKVRQVTKLVKKQQFKMRKVKPVVELSTDDSCFRTHKLLLIDPSKLGTVAKEFASELEKLGVAVDKVSYYELEVNYDHWSLSDVLRAVLPPDSDGVSSFSVIGHIAHLNLKDDLQEYKHLIGQVILDKNHCLKTVVNKVNTIDNTFRSFQMELLAGESQYVTVAKENNCAFQLDFSKVYWNPRLSTEHSRVVEMLQAGDVLYDVFAGVGPFAVPAAKKGVSVLANDLNPDSFAALVSNVHLNKVKDDRLKAFNMDGRQFLEEVVKQDLQARLQSMVDTARLQDGDTKQDGPAEGREKLESEEDLNQSKFRDGEKHYEEGLKQEAEHEKDELAVECMDKASEWKPDLCTNMPEGSGTSEIETNETSPTSQTFLSASSSPNLFVTMNLPAMAPEFLDAFCGLLSDFPSHLRTEPAVEAALPTVLCYCFSKNPEAEVEARHRLMEAEVRERVRGVMGRPLPEGSCVRIVRNVAPNKEMMCVRFRLTPEVLFSPRTAARVHEAGAEAEHDNGGPALKKQKLSG